MEPRKPVVKDHPNLSPSPEAPNDSARLQSLMRSSRATSEARSDMEEPSVRDASSVPYDHGKQSSTSRTPAPYGQDGYPADVESRLTEEQRVAYRNSRAGSEVPQRGGQEEGGAATHSSNNSPAKRAMQQQQYRSQRSSRAGSEVPEREGDGQDLSYSTRAGSEASQRHYDAAATTAASSKVSRGASVVSSAAGGGTGGGSTQVLLSPNVSGLDTMSPLQESPHQQQTRRNRTVRQARPNEGSTTGVPGPTGHGGAPAAGADVAPTSARQVSRDYCLYVTPSEHIRDVENYIYHTVKRSKGSFEYFQLLHYPVDSNVSATASFSPEEVLGYDLAAIDGEAVGSAGEAAGSSGAADEAGKVGSAARNESSPSPRNSGSPGVVLPPGAASAEGSAGGSALNSAGQLMTPSKEDSDSPSPHFDSATFNSSYEAQGFLNASGDSLENSFSLAVHGAEEPVQQSVSVLSMTTLPDPVSGAPVLGICLGDYNGHIEYFEVSSSEANNKKIRKSKSSTRDSRRSLSDKTKGTKPAGSVSESVDSEATVNITQDMRGRELARRHSHKAFTKSINALTSVAVEPCVKCLSFVRPASSPSMISYLTANERVIKLYHVRREGFTPFSAFPFMESAVGRTFLGSRYFARLPQQTSILPIKEYGPSANSIQALSVSADGETFLSVEDLQVFWWNFEAADTTKATCIADLRPPSGALDEVEELVTAASFHPTHSSLFMLSRSSGVLNIGDLRDPPSRAHRQYAITTQVTPQQNPTSCQAYDEILCSISAAAFLSPDHVVTRDYLSLKLWDLRKPNLPYAMTPVMNYVSRYLDSLYENDSIFDRFPIAVDDVSKTVVTGLYDGAVAVWQPLSTDEVSSADVLVHYRADPFIDPLGTSAGGRVSVDELQNNLSASWGGSAGGTQLQGGGLGADGAQAMENGSDEIPEPFTNKVLNVAIAPGGERFGYTYKNGRLVYVFERKSATRRQ